MITVLAGGVGAAKFLDGLARVVPPEDVMVIANTGDDACFHGLHVSPDIDTIVYTLAGLIDPEHGWGLAGDTFHCLQALGKLGAETWFNLGDRDLATHLRRTTRLREGASLSEITRELCVHLGCRCRVIPMTDSTAPTKLHTSAGALSFQEYFVKLRQEPRVLAMDFSQAAAALPATGVLESIAEAEAVIVAPSNPFLSIGPILAVRGIRDALRSTRALVAAITPIIDGKALKGPTDRMLSSLGFKSSAVSVAELYRDFLDIFVLDSQDASLQEEVEKTGIGTLVTDTVMTSAAARKQLARAILQRLSESRATSL